MTSPGLKTYSHLAHRREIPSEYAVTTSQLLYHPERGFEVSVPLAAWYRQYQQGSPLRCASWEEFEDPRQTTYASYTALQARQEAHVEGLLRSIEAQDYDRNLSADAAELLAKAVAPLRFAFHGLQMVAAYVGQMAPGGRIAITALLQAADELRRLQRVAYRAAQLRQARPEFARVDEQSRALWQEHVAWQPMRRLLERMLVAYDWGEALVALNVCAKPLLDELMMVELSRAAAHAGDHLLGEILFSLAEDCTWHRAWTQALVATALSERSGYREDNRQALERWTAAWLPPALEAAAGLATLLGSADADPGGVRALAGADARAAAFRTRLLSDTAGGGEARA